MSVFGCVDNTIRLRSGRYFDLANPKADQFTERDIAGALAKICRFGGQIERFYSVAEHSCGCAIVARNDGYGRSIVRACLLHDAAEAFVGDCVKPLKILLQDFGKIETAIESVIAERFGIIWDVETCGIVRDIDQAMLIHERKTLFSSDDVKWFGEDEVRKLDIVLECFPPDAAENLFLDLLGATEP